MMQLARNTAMSSDGTSSRRRMMPMERQRYSDASSKNTARYSTANTTNPQKWKSVCG